MARCESFLLPSHKFRRCKREPLPGSKYCERHQQIDRSPGYLPRSYIYEMRPALAELVEKQLAQGEVLDQLGLDEELALVRIAANDFIKLYGAARDAGSVKPETLAACGQAMTAAIKEVVDVAESAGRLSELRSRLKNGLAPVFEQVVTAVTHAAYETWGTDIKVGEFTAKIRERLKTFSVAGTLVTPDQDVSEMDASVP